MDDYEWDFRNRLVELVTWTDDSRTTATQIVAMRYDAFNRRIAKLVDSNGDQTFDTEQHYVYDGDNIALVFNAAGSLTNRFLPGPAVDQVLADENLLEQVTAAARVRWPLPDNLGTGRDIVDNDGDVPNHISYDSFGNRIAETNSAIDHIFGWTGRDFDEETGLQYNRARYYDPSVGRWISEDPAGFAAADANLNRYVGNGPTNSTDPSGLDAEDTNPDLVNANTVPGIFFVDELPGREYERKGLKDDDPGPNWDSVGLFDESEPDRRDARERSADYVGDPIGASTIDEAIDDLTDYSKRKGKIDALTVIDDGNNKKGQTFGPGNVDGNYIGPGDWRRIGGLLGPDPYIYLLGCDVGGATAYCQMVADETGATVIANDGYITHGVPWWWNYGWPRPYGADGGWHVYPPRNR